MGRPKLSSVTEKCVTCGSMFERASGRRVDECPSCKVARSVDAQTQMHEKDGPIYEKVVRKQNAHWRAEAKRLGIR